MWSVCFYTKLCFDGIDLTWKFFSTIYGEYIYIYMRRKIKVERGTKHVHFKSIGGSLISLAMSLTIEQNRSQWPSQPACLTLNIQTQSKAILICHRMVLFFIYTTLHKDHPKTTPTTTIQNSNTSHNYKTNRTFSFRTRAENIAYRHYNFSCNFPGPIPSFLFLPPPEPN
jgi:hypothetical protein